MLIWLQVATSYIVCAYGPTICRTRREFLSWAFCRILHNYSRISSYNSNYSSSVPLSYILKTTAPPYSVLEVGTPSDSASIIITLHPAQYYIFFCDSWKKMGWGLYSCSISIESNLLIQSAFNFVLAGWRMWKTQHLHHCLSLIRRDQQ